MGSLAILGFGNKLLDFLEYLENVSGISGISELKTSLRLVKNTGQINIIKQIMTHFMIKVQDHSDEIFNCNEDYFFELDIADLLGSELHTETVSRETEEFKKRFKEFKPEDKKRIWGYLQDLMKIGAKYFSN
jgi:hypothetical protein